jgi:hypothetical protein
MGKTLQAIDNDPWQEKRRHRRSAVIWPAVITLPDGERPCTVMNLSLGGARIKVARLPAADVALRLRIAGVGQFPGRVVWLKGDGAGVQFAIAPEVAARSIGRALESGRSPV